MRRSNYHINSNKYKEGEKRENITSFSFFPQDGKRSVPIIN